MERQDITKLRGGYRDERVLWVEVGNDEIVLEAYTHDPDRKSDFAQPTYEDTISYVVTEKKGKRKATQTMFEKYTVEELEALQEFWDEVFARAIEQAKILDQRAQEEYESGDTTNPRLYRRLPAVHRRARQKRQHDPGV